MGDFARRSVEAGGVAFKPRNDVKVKMKKMLVARRIIVLPQGDAIGGESFLGSASYSAAVERIGPARWSGKA